MALYISVCHIQMKRCLMSNCRFPRCGWFCFQITFHMLDIDNLVILPKSRILFFVMRWLIKSKSLKMLNTAWSMITTSMTKQCCHGMNWSSGGWVWISWKAEVILLKDNFINGWGNQFQKHLHLRATCFIRTIALSNRGFSDFLHYFQRYIFILIPRPLLNKMEKRL